MNAIEPRFTPHPDFGTISDERLKLQQGLLQAEIDDADDELGKVYLEQRMRMLQAERKRRAKSPDNNNGHQPAAENDKPLLVTMDQVKAQTVSWLWTNRISFSRLILLDGDPGAAKSYLSLAIAAALSAGRPLPGDNKQRGREQVLLMSVEDDYADTVRPRLDALGADVSRIAIPNPQRDDLMTGNLHAEFIERAVKACGPALVVIDPIIAFAGGKNTDRANEVR